MTETTMLSSLSRIALYGVVSSMNLDRTVGLVSRTVYYGDLTCSAGQETSEVLTFGGMIEEINPIGLTTVFEPFNTCHKTSEGSSRIPVCDLVNGKTGLVEYSPDDELCKSKPLSSMLVDHSECIVLSPSGCMDGRPCAAKAMCIDDEPSDITGTGFNFEAVQYYDEACKFPTGAAEVVDGRMFGSIEGCKGAAVVGGGNYELLQCQDHGGVMAQGFASDDTTCSGEVLFELIEYKTGGAFFGSRPLEIGGLYYRLGSCTYAQATVVGDGMLYLEANAVALTSIPTARFVNVLMRMLFESEPPTPTPPDILPIMTATMVPTSREEAEASIPTEGNSWPRTVLPSAAPTSTDTGFYTDDDDSDTSGVASSTSRAVATITTALALSIVMPFRGFAMQLL